MNLTAQEFEFLGHGIMSQEFLGTSGCNLSENMLMNPETAEANLLR